jgi:hypothetical protein
MQLSRRWLDWQPSQVSPIPHATQLTKPTEPPVSGPNSGAPESFVNSVSLLESRPKLIPPIQTAYSHDGFSPRAMPPGVKLVHWEPLPAPVQLNRGVIVTDTARFIEVTLRQLGARLQGHDWRAGNWSLSELIGRLETVGVGVALIEDVHSVH